MAEDLLLTELCMICHTRPYKYCCPRCSSRTCSLPCLKRHKQWASCTGIRDPSAYIKRSDLVTPKGIDHDYNYLTSIERQFDIAERDFESRGILLYDEKTGYNKPVKGQVPLENAIKQCRVVVDKAPKGMSRQKQNATRWDKRAKRIVWTVEWVHKNGTREIGQCPDTEAIAVAYDKIVTSKTAAEEGRPTKKLKTEIEMSRPPASANITTPKQPHTAPEHCQSSEQSSSQAGEHPQLATLKEGPRCNEPLPSSAGTEPPSSPSLSFYLLLPSTPTSYRVLISLSPTDTLAIALTDRLVLEFPTIYALNQPPDKLPTGFMTEDEYLKGMSQRGHLDRHLDGLFSEEGGSEHEDTNGHGKQDLNGSALMDVLKKDLVREVDAG